MVEKKPTYVERVVLGLKDCNGSDGSLKAEGIIFKGEDAAIHRFTPAMMIGLLAITPLVARDTIRQRIQVEYPDYSQALQQAEATLPVYTPFTNSSSRGSRRNSVLAEF